MKSFIFWDITACSPLNVNRCFRGTCCLRLHATCFMLVLCMAYSSTLKKEETCPSETSFDFQRTTWRYIPEDRTLNKYNNLHVTYSFIETLNPLVLLFLYLLYHCSNIRLYFWSQELTSELIVLTLKIYWQFFRHMWEILNLGRKDFIDDPRFYSTVY
jgi:hypothetical protein